MIAAPPTIMATAIVTACQPPAQERLIPGPCRRFESSRRHHLRLAVQQALPLLPLFLGSTQASPLRDGVDDADEGGEDHGRESDEGQGHGREGRGVEFIAASYRTG